MRTEPPAMELMLQKQVDGIVNMPVSRGGAHLVPALEKGLPVVLIGWMINGLDQAVNAVLHTRIIRTFFR